MSIFNHPHKPHPLTRLCWPKRSAAARDWRRIFLFGRSQQVAHKWCVDAYPNILIAVVIWDFAKWCSLLHKTHTHLDKHQHKIICKDLFCFLLFVFSPFFWGIFLVSLMIDQNWQNLSWYSRRIFHTEQNLPNFFRFFFVLSLFLALKFDPGLTALETAGGGGSGDVAKDNKIINCDQNYWSAVSLWRGAVAELRIGLFCLDILRRLFLGHDIFSIHFFSYFFILLVLCDTFAYKNIPFHIINCFNTTNYVNNHWNCQ